MMGIMHRDIKPQNIIINPISMQIRVIDWGLADFYFPGREYSVKVASRVFKAPELLLNNRKYDYSMDIWSLGCIFAAIVIYIIINRLQIRFLRKNLSFLRLITLISY